MAGLEYGLRLHWMRQARNTTDKRMKTFYVRLARDANRQQLAHLRFMARSRYEKKRAWVGLRAIAQVALRRISYDVVFRKLLRVALMFQLLEKTLWQVQNQRDYILQWEYGYTRRQYPNRLRRRTVLVEAALKGTRYDERSGSKHHACWYLG